MTKLLAFAAACGFVGAITTPVHATTVLSASFESPSLGSGYGAYAYGDGQPFANAPSVPTQDLSSSGAIFQGASGIQANGSAFGFVNAPDGTQTAFIQSYNNIGGYFYFDLTGLTPGQSYQISFDAANRPGYTPLLFAVFTNETTAIYTATTTAWTSFTTDFTPLTSSDQISFVGNTASGDSDVGIDAIAVVPVPEPASWALMLAGLSAVGWSMRRRSRLRVRIAN